MRYQSNLNNVLRALDDVEERALTAVGEYGRSEMQMRSPVKTGAYRDSQDYRLDMNEKKVMLGNSLDYAIWIEEGSSRQQAQHVIRNSVYDNISRIKSLISEMMRL